MNKHMQTLNELRHLRTLARERGLTRIAALLHRLIAEQEKRHEH